MLIIRIHSYDGAHHFYVGPPEHANWKIINLVMLSGSDRRERTVRVRSVLMGQSVLFYHYRYYLS